MDEFENYIKIKSYLVYKNNIDLIFESARVLVKVCQFSCHNQAGHNSNFCYFHESKPNQTKYISIKIKLVHEIRA